MSQSNANLSVVLRKPKDIVLENRPVPELGYGDVLVNVKATGICGSDIHYWLHGAIGSYVLKQPMVLGHESAGIVVAVGPGVSHLKVGDRVALEPGVACRRCAQCKGGRYNLCPDMAFAATPPIDGTLCNYFRHAADFCHKLPDHVSFAEGALIEPLSVGIHAARRGNVAAGDHVLIFGAGPVGLLCAAAAKAFGARRVTIADVVPERIAFAKGYYTDLQILLQRSLPHESNMDYARRTASAMLAAEPLADCVIDCSGAEVCVQMSVLLCKNGGTVVLVGMGGSTQLLPMSEVSGREVDIKGVFRYCNTYPLAVELLASGSINVKPLITHTYPLEDAVKAFEHVQAGRDGAIKVQIVG